MRWWDGGQWTAHVRPAHAPAPPVATEVPDTFATYARREGDRVVVPAAAVAGGLAPDRCVAHGARPVEHRRVTFLSSTPIWVFLIMIASILIALIVALAVRKKVVAPAWPLCEECLATQRRNRWLMIGSLLAWVPLIWVGSRIAGDLGAWLTLAAVLVPVLAAIVFGSRSALRSIAKATVSADGLTVSLPAGALPPRAATPAGSGVMGTTLLPGR